MTNITLLVTASLDSFIGRQNGENFPPMAIGSHPLYFLTRHKLVIVGRKSYEATLQKGRGHVFNNRTVVVLSRNPLFSVPSRLTATTIEEAIALAEAKKKTEVFVLGGTEVFYQTVGRATKIYLALLESFLNPRDSRPFIFPEDAWLWTRWELKNKKHNPIFILKKKGLP